MQSAYKASYPPGEAREDWIILKNLAEKMKKPLNFNNVNELRKHIKNNIKSNSEKVNQKIKKVDFIESNITIRSIDYYYTNPIARASKVMNECRQISKKFMYNGIEKAS